MGDTFSCYRCNLHPVTGHDEHCQECDDELTGVVTDDDEPSTCHCGYAGCDK